MKLNEIVDERGMKKIRIGRTELGRDSKAMEVMEVMG